MSSEPPIRFPDAPRSELERSIEDLMERAQHVLAVQDRMRSLLRATRAIGEDLNLPVVLRRIAEAAVDLVGARYGALGVIGPDGALEQFVHVGLSAEDATAIGPLPHGRGILGAVIDDHSPIRLDHLAEDPRSTGFPQHHPGMDSFVGVPIRVRGEIFGNLYLTDRADGPFTEEDEELLEFLATSAGMAIDNARLFGESQRRQRWATASAEVSAALPKEEGADPLQVIANAVASTTDASTVLVVMRTSTDSLVVEHAWGDYADDYAGHFFPIDGTTGGSVMASGAPVLSYGLPLPDETSRFTGPAMVLPLMRGGKPCGVLALIRPLEAPSFSDGELEMAMAFASHASVALELREARRARERMAVLEDRSRIARDLHDHVIQRLFAAGFALHSIDRPSLTTPVAGKVETVAGMLDEAIAHIRTAVFALSTADRAGMSARHRLLDIVGEAANAFTTPPKVLFEGQLDEWAPSDMVSDLEAVVREGLSNAARHAEASAVVVTISANESEICLQISDDGRGVPAHHRSSGTANLETRATAWGGHSSLKGGDYGGSTLEWRVPTPQRKGAT